MAFKDFANAIIGAGGSVLNGITGLIATNKANNTNREIARETNASNERINQAQIDYNWDMFHAQNEYNNPLNQRKRLVDAGLNPIYYGLDGNSSASGQAFTPIASEQASPTIPNDFSAFGDAAMKFAQIRNLEASTKKMESDAGLSTENAETIRQLRSGQIELQGQQIKLNVDQHELNGAKRDEILASVDSLRQSVNESSARIDDIKSQIGYRAFEQRLRQCEYELDKRVREGLLSVHEKQLVLSWFEANTNRMNASTNYFNAETNRMATSNQVFQDNQMLPFRKRWTESMSFYNSEQGYFTHDQNKRYNKAFNLEQLTRAANAYTSIIDAMFAYPSRNVGIVNGILGR